MPIPIANWTKCFENWTDEKYDRDDAKLRNIYERLWLWLPMPCVALALLLVLTYIIVICVSIRRRRVREFVQYFKMTVACGESKTIAPMSNVLWPLHFPLPLRSEVAAASGVEQFLKIYSTLTPLVGVKH